jgi:hypothetical protein
MQESVEEGHKIADCRYGDTKEKSQAVTSSSLPAMRLNATAASAGSEEVDTASAPRAPAVSIASAIETELSKDDEIERKTAAAASSSVVPALPRSASGDIIDDDEILPSRNALSIDTGQDVGSVDGSGGAISSTSVSMKTHAQSHLPQHLSPTGQDGCEVCSSFEVARSCFLKAIGVGPGEVDSSLTQSIHEEMWIARCAMIYRSHTRSNGHLPIDDFGAEFALLHLRKAATLFMKIPREDYYSSDRSVEGDDFTFFGVRFAEAFASLQRNIAYAHLALYFERIGVAAVDTPDSTVGNYLASDPDEASDGNSSLSNNSIDGRKGPRRVSRKEKNVKDLQAAIKASKLSLRADSTVSSACDDHNPAWDLLHVANRRLALENSSVV